MGKCDERLCAEGGGGVGGDGDSCARRRHGHVDPRLNHAPHPHQRNRRLSTRRERPRRYAAAPPSSSIDPSTDDPSIPSPQHPHHHEQRRRGRRRAGRGGEGGRPERRWERKWRDRCVAVELCLGGEQERCSVLDPSKGWDGEGSTPRCVRCHRLASRSKIDRLALDQPHQPPTRPTDHSVARAARPADVHRLLREEAGARVLALLPRGAPRRPHAPLRQRGHEPVQAALPRCVIGLGCV